MSWYGKTAALIPRLKNCKRYLISLLTHRAKISRVRVTVTEEKYNFMTCLFTRTSGK